MINCFPVPERSQQLQAVLTRIQALGSSEFFVDRHLGAVAKTVTAVFIASFDTIAYTGKALSGCFIAILELDFSKSLEELMTNIADAVRSLSMVAILSGFAVSGIFIPQTSLGNFPTFAPPIDFQAESIRLQAELTQAQTQLDELPNLRQELEALRSALTELQVPFAEEASQPLAEPAVPSQPKKPPVDLKAMETRISISLKDITQRSKVLTQILAGIQAAQAKIAQLQENSEEAAATKETELQPLKTEIQAVCQEAAKICEAFQKKKEEQGLDLSESDKGACLSQEIRQVAVFLKKINICLQRGQGIIPQLQRELQALKDRPPVDKS